MIPRRPVVVTLRVADLDRSLAFWNGVLGLPVKLRTGQLVELQAEAIGLLLVEDPAAGAPGESPALGFEVDDLDAARAFLERQGLTVAEVEVAGEDARCCAFRDPDGHRLELVAPLPRARGRAHAERLSEERPGSRG